MRSAAASALAIRRPWRTVASFRNYFPRAALAWILRRFRPCAPSTWHARSCLRSNVRTRRDSQTANRRLAAGQACPIGRPFHVVPLSKLKTGDIAMKKAVLGATLALIGAATTNAAMAQSQVTIYGVVDSGLVY